MLISAKHQEYQIYTKKVELKKYEHQGIELKQREYSVAFHRDAQTFIGLYQEYLSSQTESQLEELSMIEDELETVKTKIKKKSKKFTKDEIKLLKTSGNYVKNLMQAEEDFILQNSFVKDPRTGETECKSNMVILFEMFLDKGNEINVNVTGDAAFELIEFAQNVMKDFFLFARNSKLKSRLSELILNPLK